MKTLYESIWDPDYEPTKENTINVNEIKELFGDDWKSSCEVDTKTRTVIIKRNIYGGTLCHLGLKEQSLLAKNQIFNVKINVRTNIHLSPLLQNFDIQCLDNIILSFYRYANETPVKGNIDIKNLSLFTPKIISVSPEGWKKGIDRIVFDGCNFEANEILISTQSSNKNIYAGGPVGFKPNCKLSADRIAYSLKYFPKNKYITYTETPDSFNFEDISKCFLVPPQAMNTDEYWVHIWKNKYESLESFIFENKQRRKSKLALENGKPLPFKYCFIPSRMHTDKEFWDESIRKHIYYHE